MNTNKQNGDMDYMTIDYLAAEDAVEGITKGVPVKPQRGGVGTRQVPQEKPKSGNRKPAGKKTVVPNRAPSRGKYIDEYARPSA